MKKLIYLIVLALILGLVLTGCSLLSNISQVPAPDQSGITYLTKAILSSDIVGLWHFDEESVAITIADSSGYGNDGDVHGATTGVPGKFGNALSFDGDDYVEVPHVTILNPTSAITVECWAKLDRVDVHSVLVRKMNTYSLQVTVGLNGEGARLEGWVKIGGVWKGVRGVVGGETLTSGTWYHFSFTYDGANVVTYVNGAFDRSNGVTGSIDSTSNTVNIGRCGPPETVHGSTYGLIDEVRIWDFALSQDQLGKVYDFKGFFPPIDSDVDVFNVVKAGRAIPVKFSLNGYQGLDTDIFVPGYPKSIQIKCPDADAEPDDEMEFTETAGESSLSYDADQYIYVWKTDKDWTGCRQLIVKLIDGTSHVANFTFK